MKNILLLLFLVCYLLPGRAQWVEIPDPNFLNALGSTNAGSCLNGAFLDTSCTEVQNLTEFSCSNCGIADLEGLEYFPNLDSINVEFNDITYMPSLPAGLKKLKANDCYYLNELPALPGGLQQLYVSNTGLTSLPPLPAGLKALELGMSPGNFLDTLPATFPSGLQSLVLDRIDAIPLPAFPATLSYLEVRNSVMTSLPVLPTGLVNLRLDNSYLTVVPVLPSSLKQLQLRDLSQLNTYPSFPAGIQSLTLDYIGLSSLPALPDSLNSLSSTGCSFAGIPSLPNQLVYLSVIADTALTSLPALPPNLRTLQIFTSKLQSLPTLPDSLRTLNVRNNALLNYIPSIPQQVYFIDASYTAISTLTNLPVALRSLSVFKSNYTGLLDLPIGVDSMDYLRVDSNPGLTCLSRLPARILNFGFGGSGLVCLPNYATVTSCTPALNSLPVCGLFNANGCSTPWNISGQTYFGNSCTYNNSFNAAELVKVKLFENGQLQQQVYSVLDGNYYFDVNHYGTYSVQVDTGNMPYVVACPAGGSYTSVIQAVDSMDTGLNFALQCKPGFDAAVTAISANSVFRPAQTTTLHVLAGNLANLNYHANCAPGTSAVIKLVINGPVNYAGMVAGGLTPSQVVNDSVIWNISDLNALTVNDFRILLQTDSLAQIGDQACFYVSIAPGPAGDFNTANNSLQYCQPIVNSYDPNEKQAYPVAILDTLGFMTYTVRFQNTGNAPALHVQVVDTLDSNLDPATFELLDFSHANLTQVIGSVVKFNFPNINLPDSFSNEPGSHGFVQYRIKTRHNLSPAAHVKNTAYIYFDFNAPVVTNTVENAVGACVPVYTSLQQTICSGDTYNFNGTLLHQAGTYSDTLLNALNCDSIVHLQLQFYPVVSPPYFTMSCWTDTNQANFCGSCGFIFLQTQTYDSATLQVRCSNIIDTVFTNLDTLLLHAMGWNSCGFNLTTLDVPDYTPIELCYTFYTNCGVLIMCDTMELMPEGITETPLDNFRLYPNPASLFTTIVTDEWALGGNLELYDVTGKLLSSRLITGSQQYISTASLSAGVYLVLVRTKSGAARGKRIVVE